MQPISVMQNELSRLEILAVIKVQINKPKTMFMEYGMSFFQIGL